MRIYIGNMNYATTDETLRELFEQHGQVEEVAVVNDRQTGRPRGIAFVVMPDRAQAEAAIEAINGLEVEGRTLTVHEARPRNTGRSGGGGG